MQEEYDNSYCFSPIARKGDKGTRMPNNKEIRDTFSETTMRADKTGPHPGLPWFKWDEKSGHPGYRAVDQGRVIQCPYIWYGVHQGVPYEMGTEGAESYQFARELYAYPRPLVDAPNANDRDLDIFTQDVPFNFAAEQVLDRLDDPGALAEVG